MFFINHALKFQYQPIHLKVKLYVVLHSKLSGKCTFLSILYIKFKLNLTDFFFKKWLIMLKIGP